MSIPSTMKAWVYRKAGPVKDVLKLETDHPVPVPADDEVLVKVKSVSLNPIGWKTFTLLGKIPYVVKMPGVPESDFSGTVVADSADGKWKKGDDVFGMQPVENIFKTGKGVLSEYAVLASIQLHQKPDATSFSEAASVPLAALTAYHSLITIGKLAAGQKVFINGGSGGVGCYAIQIAKSLGAKVYTTGSGPKADFVKRCGADEVVDYRQQDIATWLLEKSSEAEGGKFDLAFDAVGLHEVYMGSKHWLDPKTGRYVDVGADMHSLGDLPRLVKNQIVKRLPRFLCGSSVPYTNYVLSSAATNTDGEGQALNQLARMMSGGKLRSQIDEEFAFEDAQAAYEKQMSGRTMGKIVINIP